MRLAPGETCAHSPCNQEQVIGQGSPTGPLLWNLSFLFGTRTTKAYSLSSQSQVDVGLSQWPSRSGHLTRTLEHPVPSFRITADIKRCYLWTSCCSKGLILGRIKIFSSPYVNPPKHLWGQHHCYLHARERERAMIRSQVELGESHSSPSGLRSAPYTPCHASTVTSSSFM